MKWQSSSGSGKSYLCDFLQENKIKVKKTLKESNDELMIVFTL